MTELQARRRFYAEEIEAVANLTSTAVVEALATVARERFLPPGPWTIRGEADFLSAARQTADADPRHVYHNIAIAIDPARMLFNGAPSVLAMAIDALQIEPGARVLHLGTGLGYYTALMADCTGPSGRVLGLEVDADLAGATTRNLAEYPWTEVRVGDGSEALGESFDAILINAGVTHPLSEWFDALEPRGRLIVPLTATMGPGPIGKGPFVLMTGTGDPERLAARIAGFVAIYSAVGIRDEAANAALGKALTRSPLAPIKTVRRDAHDAGPGCWLHTPGFCLSRE